MTSLLFDKNLLFGGKSIRQRKDRIKNERGGKARGKRGFLRKTGLCRVGLFKLITV
jgi:hypothetical protein